MIPVRVGGGRDGGVICLNHLTLLSPTDRPHHATSCTRQSEGADLRLFIINI